LLKLKENLNLYRYILRGRKPWAKGYREYKEKTIKNSIVDKDLFETFKNKKPLPCKYGVGVDERAVEYPWLFSRLRSGRSLLLDCGSALNHQYLFNDTILGEKDILIYNLAREKENIPSSKISYVYGDIRENDLKNETWDDICCISTLEHIGMNNTFLYTSDEKYREGDRRGYVDVLNEFKRLIKPGGNIFITVPFGEKRSLGWLQIFDHKMIEEITEIFSPWKTDTAYYLYADNGWQLSSAAECSMSGYFDVNLNGVNRNNRFAAAQSVVCMEIKRTG